MISGHARHPYNVANIVEAAGGGQARNRSALHVAQPGGTALQVSDAGVPMLVAPGNQVVWSSTP